MTKITDPDVLKFIADTQAAFPSEAIEADIPACREYYNAMCKVFWQPHPKGVGVTDAEVDGVPVRRYRPESCEERAILYTHGGGFVVGSLDSHDDVCAELVPKSGQAITGCRLSVSILQA